MSYVYFTSVNVPVSVFIIFMNIFFIYCLVFQQHTQEQLKQPLKTLQGILIGCNILINVCTLFRVCIYGFPSHWSFLVSIVVMCMVFIMMISETSCFCQNVFYYCQISPTQSYFIWFKKNISVLTYCALLITVIVNLYELSLISAVIVLIQSVDINNGTITDNSRYTQLMNVIVAWKFVYFLIISLLVLNLCGMSISSCATVICLWKHLKNMEKSITVSSPRLQKQIRMIIRSIEIHAVIHFICSVSVSVDVCLQTHSGLCFDTELNILCTVISFYALGSTITLGMTQSLFRKQIAYAWKKIF